MQFLPELPDGIDLDELNRRFCIYIDEVYHTRIHGGTGQTPLKRYLEDSKVLRPAPENLPEYFRTQATRRVNKDRTVKLDGRVFEAPPGLVGQQVVLRYETYDRIEVFLDGESRGFLTALNTEVNSRIGRTPAPQPETTGGGQLFERLSDSRSS